MTTSERRTIIIAASPTSNGDCMSSTWAYLADDVTARCGATRERLCATSLQPIQRSFESMGHLDHGLSRIDDPL